MFILLTLFIAVGDLVYSYDTLTGEVSQKEVTATFVRESDHINYLTIVDENGNEQVIETTDGHPFWVVTDTPDLKRAARSVVDENGFILYHENVEPGLNGFWVEAKDLRVGDVFLGANGELSVLVDSVRVEYDENITVYNFSVDGNHDYFVIAKGDYGQTCVLVHNMCAKPKKTKPPRGNTPGNLGDVKAKALKNNGINPHDFKEGFVGEDFVSKFDIKINKSTGELVIVPHQIGTGIPPQRVILESCVRVEK